MATNVRMDMSMHSNNIANGLEAYNITLAATPIVQSVAPCPPRTVLWLLDYVLTFRLKTRRTLIQTEYYDFLGRAHRHTAPHDILPFTIKLYPQTVLSVMYVFSFVWN
jgi:hypothetical protein